MHKRLEGKKKKNQSTLKVESTMECVFVCVEQRQEVTRLSGCESILLRFIGGSLFP